MKKVVFSLGGSVIVPGQVNEKFLIKFGGLLLNFLKRDYRFVVVCGGGKICRDYINAALNLGISEKKAHILGIEVTKLNAMLLYFLLKNYAFLDFGDPRKVKMRGRKIIISAGYKPGWNTDVDAAYICKALNCDFLINISNTIGVYDKDPRKNKDAKLIEEMRWKEFLNRFGNVKVVPGLNFIFHPLAARICARNNINVFFVSSDIRNLRNLLNGKKFIGTRVH
ncbi:MAG: UMP kinase [Candidatus Parvarchaeota archaeon]|nr:UMP kinase [Candidatus Jingweiarchaeum tengchongense]MCW1298445.1 UMP kinase [Candidatus Jingweiarchaeum tengchongense]MCW1300537.1 UMP kinase [Candidatus Jingweiarchaeum tengchongense]MCW1304988.1 UMP kinase [Candidatus Jingweiarchaeum tengchongense]MCW1306008.1 UMP kinase [Candidatus Jingweiarchaeum tengchongense]